MSGIVLSVIVPSCNVGAFITRCVQSIFEGHPEGIEIIAVDDASSDDTFEQLSLCTNVAGFRIIRNEANAGLGASRNIGLAAAKGSYVWFVDGDDFVADGTVDKITGLLAQGQHDVVVLDFGCANETGKPIDWIRCPFGPDHGNTFTGPEFFARYFDTTYAWAYIVKRDLLVRNGLEFQPRINMQDAELLPRIMACAGSVLVSGIPAYQYVQRRGSFINSSDGQVRDRYFASVIEVFQRLCAFRKTADDPALRAGLDAKIRSVERILMLAFVYDGLGRPARSSRLAALQEANVFPFRGGDGETTKMSTIRHFVNIFPLTFPVIFSILRHASRSMVSR